MVFLGAFGSHILQGQITAQDLNTFYIAARYHAFHTLALLGIAILYARDESRFLRVTAYAFINGLILFSGSLYLKSIDRLIPADLTFLTPLVPLGGVFFMMGWLMLAYYGFFRAKVHRIKRTSNSGEEKLEE